MPGEGVHRVVVIGGGFGGLEAVRKLSHAPVEITLIDRRNFHLFQPLTYQVATGALSAGDIAYPLRAIFKRNENVRVLMAEASEFDLTGRQVHLRPVGGGAAPASIPYDTLIVAGGSRYSYFGHDHWSEHAAEVKSLESALAVRGSILAAFEAAEGTEDPDARAAYLTFVVVGGGPTGVEMAGQIGELARDPRSAAHELPALALQEGTALARAARRHADVRRHRRRPRRRVGDRRGGEGPAQADPDPDDRVGRRGDRLGPRRRAE